MRLNTVTVFAAVGLALTVHSQFAQAQQAPTVQVAPRTEHVLRAQTPQATGKRLADASGFQPLRSQPKPKPVAVGGFCIVTLRDRQEWVPGEIDIQATFDGRSYRFANSRLREIFAVSPEQYVPVLNGDCPVTFVETGQRVAGSLAFGLVHQERVLFFRGSDELEAFRGNPDSFFHADLANQGFCLVSQKLENKQVQGLPQALVMVDGLRYVFADAHKQFIFASNPGYFGVNPTSSVASHFSRIQPGGQKQLGGDSLGQPQTDASSSLTDRTGVPRLPQSEQFVGGSNSSSQGAPDEQHNVTLYRGTQSPVMSGYCVVTIRKYGIWVRGKSNLFLSLNDHIYFFAGPDEQKAFREDPESFVPVLDGDCIVAYRDQNVREPGSPYFSLEFQDRLYLFADQESKEKFRNHLAQYEHADLAFDGNCVVTQSREGRQLTGLPEFEIPFRGKRYRFATDEKRRSFQQEPDTFAVP